MAIPTYEDLMLPLLKVLSETTEKSLRELVKILSGKFNLTKEEREKLLPSGHQTIIHNRVGWARTYLSKTGLLINASRGVYKITARGLEVLQQNPSRIDNNFLRRFPKFIEWNNIKREKTNDVLTKDESEAENTPEESLETSYQTIRVALASEIIEKVKTCSPAFFERLVVELLVKMGYGGTLQEAGKAVGKSGDGGIDGIINEDRLGLDVIYLQAKRWEGNVSRPEIQKFAGALQGKRARKGVFITTSDFTKEAREYAAMIDSKIILIDGEELAELMIDYNVGVSVATTYEIKRIDSDYFSED
ncbi:MAG: restriction endonuclease [Pyrinomonadaceae bacterium]